MVDSSTDSTASQSTREKGLCICPTPIGNLNDISQRQLEALRFADVILCEDTRTTGKLLELLGVKRVDGIPALCSYHEHNEASRLPQIMAFLKQDKSVVLVSDAGTPTISDPGFRVVSEARKNNFPVFALPGAVAAMVALSASGLPTDRILFEGFLPNKSGERKKRLESARDTGATVVLYESPKRLRTVLGEIKELFGDTPVVVGRELTKKFESFYSGTVDEILAELPDPLKGECVVVISCVTAQVDHLEAKRLVLRMANAGIEPKTIRSIVRDHYGVSKKEIFGWLEDRKQS